MTIYGMEFVYELSGTAYVEDRIYSSGYYSAKVRVDGALKLITINHEKLLQLEYHIARDYDGARSAVRLCVIYKRQST